MRILLKKPVHSTVKIEPVADEKELEEEKQELRNLMKKCLQKKMDSKPLIISNFVGWKHEVKEIIFEQGKVSIRTFNGDLLSIQKKNILGFPKKFFDANFSNFLTKNYWVKVSKFNEENYILVFNARCKGGMHQSSVLEDLMDKISTKFGQNNFLQVFATKNVTLIKRELKKLMLYVGDEDQSLSTIGSLATKLFLEYDNFPRMQFQNRASEYFQKNIGSVSISFKDKLGGDQLGNRLVIQLKDGQEITFHAKTHRGGLKSQNSSSSQPVDLKELLIYKILEFSRIGAETHFFYDDIKNFYIATKDAGYNDEIRKQGEFITYDKIRKSISSEKLLKDSLIVNGFIKADIISRLLLLSDVINNGANIGVTSTGQFKVIDFNPPITKEYQNLRIYEDWLSGNNQYNYSDLTVLSILKNMNKEEKIKNSLSTLKELAGFEDLVAKSYEVVVNSLGKVSGIEELQMQDLKVYTQSIIKNYQYLMKNIEFL